MVVLKVMVNTDGQMVILTKDFLKMVKKWEKVCGRNQLMVQMILTCMKANIKMIKSMDKVNLNGQLEVIIKANTKMI
jgi:hypothetical protein